MTRALILLTFPPPVRMRYFDHIRAAFPELHLDMVDHVSKVDPFIAEAEILITFGPMLEDRGAEVMAMAKRLKWIQALGTGVDNIVDLPTLAGDVLLTNLHGIHGAAVSEAALMAMLALSRDLPRVLRNQGRHVWERWPARLLEGKTAGILGVGAIAEKLAPMLKAMGMKVVGISSGQRAVPGFDRIVGREALLGVAGELDYLILLTPYSAETHHLVDAAVLAAMKRESTLVNLARGGVVDEAALLETLQSRRIAGAALDVFDREPLPPDHPFWTLDNVIVTPHLGGFYDAYVDHALPVVEANLRRYLAGEAQTMSNLVRR